MKIVRFNESSDDSISKDPLGIFKDVKTLEDEILVDFIDMGFGPYHISFGEIRESDHKICLYSKKEFMDSFDVYHKTIRLYRITFDIEWSFKYEYRNTRSKMMRSNDINEYLNFIKCCNSVQQYLNQHGYDISVSPYDAKSSWQEIFIFEEIFK